jgi:hypothetical protein
MCVRAKVGGDKHCITSKLARHMLNFWPMRSRSRLHPSIKPPSTFPFISMASLEDYNLPSEERLGLLQRLQDAFGDAPPHF